jgi:hypothetical protein
MLAQRTDPKLIYRHRQKDQADAGIGNHKALVSADPTYPACPLSPIGVEKVMHYVYISEGNPHFSPLFPTMPHILYCA